MDKEKTGGCQGGGDWEKRWRSRLRLANVNFYIQNGLTTRSYCIAENYIQSPVINHNGKESMCV